MPSHFKYRIKKTSEKTKSVWDYDSIPPDVLKALKATGVYDPTDSNIVPATCAFIQKVYKMGSATYYCAIKLYARRPDLIPSDGPGPSQGNGRPDGWGEGRVTGAEKLSEGSDTNYWSSTHFKCKYIDSSSGKAAKEGVSDDETIQFPMCNCYTPRGGMSVTHFDGAVKASEAPGYTNPKISETPPPQRKTRRRFPVLYDNWRQDTDNSDPFMSAPIPKFLPQNTFRDGEEYPPDSFPENPPTLGFLFMMLNARARVIPCCWWTGKRVLLYDRRYFTVIDLAVAQEAAANTPDDKLKYCMATYNQATNKTELKRGQSGIARYLYREGDYFYPNDGDNYMKNILLGRNYDPTLPDCGNNQRIIYVLNPSLVGPLTKTPVPGWDSCKDIPWHYDSQLWFTPRNCGHPDCQTRYQWGSVCNGGGAFDLANGKACPNYENPLIGPEKESEKLCRMLDMYPGDYITGGAILELMWLSKGGLPWTKEEWESTWRVPYIWSTMPFNPEKIVTDEVRDQDGNLRRITGGMFLKNKVYAVRTTVDLQTGKAKQEPPLLLPGGSVTQFKKQADGKLKPGMQTPYLPSIIQALEVKSAAALNIIWPIADPSALTLKADKVEDFAQEIKKLRNKVYNQLVWGEKGKNILVMGYGSTGQYANGVYCINTAFMRGKWAQKKDRLLVLLKDFRNLEFETQKLLKELWQDLLKSQVAGEEPVMDGMEMQRALVDNRGLFVFPSVPLNLLFKENCIIVIGFNSSGATIDTSFVLVHPIFRRAYIYQQNTKLMTGWKALWSGRPSLFLNERDLKKVSGVSYTDRKGTKVSMLPPIATSVAVASFSGDESISDLADMLATAYRTLKELNKAFKDAQDADMRQRYAKQIDEQATTAAQIEEYIRTKLAQDEAATSSALVYTVAQERRRYEAEIDKLKKDQESLETKKAKASGEGNTQVVASFDALITQIKYYINLYQLRLDKLPADGSGVTTTATTTEAAKRQTEEEEKRKKEKEKEDKEKLEAEKRGPWIVPFVKDPNGKLDGDKDTDEGGSLDLGDKVTEDKYDKLGQGDLSRLYVPFLDSKRKNQKNIDSFQSILYDDDTSSPVKLEILTDSGITEWKYFEIKHGEASPPLLPHKVYAPKGTKRVIVYSTKDLAATPEPTPVAGQPSTTKPRGVLINDKIGKWYQLSNCSSMIMLVLNPVLCNRHNEFMIFSMGARVQYKWKGPDGSPLTAMRKIKFAPYNYSQVNRVFPGYQTDKTVESLGDISKFNVPHKKYAISEDIEILERDEGNRHPWIIFAIACDEQSNVNPWSSYNGQWYPGGNLITTVLPQKQDQIELYMEYAFIGEVYDQDDMRFLDWGATTSDEEKGGAEPSHKTRILFNHPKAGTIRTTFVVGDAEIGKAADVDDTTAIDGFKAVPIGSAAATCLWPYARLACRDLEIHYIWRDNKNNLQVTESFTRLAGKNRAPEARATIGPAKRFTYYTCGDHDLGNVTQPKITWQHWQNSVNEGDGTGAAKTFETEEVGYTWNRGRPATASSTPTDGFPLQGGQSYTQGDQPGPLYFPYTRGEPQSKFIPIHPVYIWDFFAHYRNKPKDKKWFGGFRLMAPNVCDMNGTEERDSTWNIYYELEPKNKTEFIGRMRTRGPVFQLEYEDYEEKKPKIVFLKPYAVRDKMTTQDTTWTYYASARTTKDETWDPDKYEEPPVSTEPKVADNPDSLSQGIWKAICRGLYDAWSRGDTTAYYDLEKQKNWGAKKGWIVTYTKGLHFPADEKYQPPVPPDPNVTRRIYLADRIIRLTNSILYSQKELEAQADDFYKVADLKTKIAGWETDRDNLEQELATIGGEPSLAERETLQPDTTLTPPEKPASTDIDPVTGCQKELLKTLDQRGSFFFDNSYMPRSVSSSKWESDMNKEADKIKEELKKQSNRFYWYEQKSFGVNTPWSPYDSPPLFGNTGRDMYIVELCTIGSIIAWSPFIPTKDVVPTVASEGDKTNVPSWWTARAPLGVAVEKITLLPPPLECTRALRLLATEPQNPYYNYLFTSGPFKESTPDITKPISPHAVRIITKHDTDNYGQPWYRSDLGRLSLTVLTDSDMASVVVIGPTPATQESDYISLVTESISESVAPATAPQPPTPNETQDASVLPPNSIKGADIKGLALESRQKTFVGHYYPGFYSPYTHGRVFVGYRDNKSTSLEGVTTTQAIHWAWPVSNRDKLKRGVKSVRWWLELPDLSTKTRMPKAGFKDNSQLGALVGLRPAPYFQKHMLADDGREVSLGPDLKQIAQPQGEKETVYADKTYYAIVVESARDYGGTVRPPIIWAQPIDNPGLAQSIDNFRAPRDGAIPYKVLMDGSISPVILGKPDNTSSFFTTGYLFPRSIRNAYPGGNFITSDKINAAGRYPAFELDSVSYRYIGKVATVKDYTTDLQKFRVIKTKNYGGYNAHRVEATFVVPNLGSDTLYIEIAFNSFFMDKISELFSNKIDGAAVEISIEGNVILGTDYLGKTFSKSFIQDLPLSRVEGLTTPVVRYDLDFGMTKNLKITFAWSIRCETVKFDTGPWKGDDLTIDPDTTKLDPQNYAYLSDLVDRITLGVLVPGKCVEVVSLEETKFIISNGGLCVQEGGPGPSQYNFFTEGDPEWYKCQWEESEKNVERDWNQENLYLKRTDKNYDPRQNKVVGEKQKDEWARAGYEDMVKSFRDAGLDYNKVPKAQAFKNSCVEIPELPQSRLKIEAWAPNKDSQNRTWVWGGIWTTRIAGPEWRTADPLPTRDYIWWPAPPYYKGQLTLKGRAWIYDEQYKDEAKVTAKKREAGKKDEYNKDAYKNQIGGFDNLMRNIQEFEVYRGQMRTQQTEYKKNMTEEVNKRKQTAFDDQMARAKTAGNRQTAGGGDVSSGRGGVDPYMTPDYAPIKPTQSFKTNDYKEYTFLDEVGITPEKAEWEKIKDKETLYQKKLYEDTIETAGKKLTDKDTIKAIAIVPYYDWEALMELTGKSWVENNGQGDYTFVSADTLASLKDELCTFTWKNWSWDELQSFTFRDEFSTRYKPEEDLSKYGLLRRCGRKWKILDKKDTKTVKSPFDVAIDTLTNEIKPKLEAARDKAKSSTTILGIQEAIDKIDSILHPTLGIPGMKSYYIDLGRTVAQNYETKMGYKLDGTTPRSYSKEQGIITALQTAYNVKAPEHIVVVDNTITHLKSVKISTTDSFKEFNKAILGALASLNLVKNKVNALRPEFRDVWVKMEFYKTVTEELRHYTAVLIGDLGFLSNDNAGGASKNKTRILQIDCHSQEDADKKGKCDPEGYPQKWGWDPTGVTTAEVWPNTVTEDDGKTLKRPDPWWRF